MMTSHNLATRGNGGKLVLNKDSAPYKSILGEKSLTGRSSLFHRGEVGTVLTTPSQLSASYFKLYRGSDKCGFFFFFQSINDLQACFCMGRYLCLEPILPVVALWRSTCKPYWTSLYPPDRSWLIFLVPGLLHRAVREPHHLRLARHRLAAVANLPQGDAQAYSQVGAR